MFDRRPRRLNALVSTLALALGAAATARADGGPDPVGWQLHTTPAEGASLDLLAIAPSAPQVVYAARDGRFGGVVESLDGGRSWTAADQGLAHAELGTGSTGLVAVNALAVYPQQPHIVYAAAVAGGTGAIFRSTTGGASWQRFGGPLAADGAPVFVLSLAIDPRRPRLMYAGTQRGLFRSRDQGRTWVALTTGPVDDTGQPRPIRQVLIEPAAPDTVWALTENDLYRSRNRGATWARREAGLPAERRVGNLAFSPLSGHGYLTLGGTASALWRTTDRGASWRPTAGRLPEDGTVALAAGSPDALLYVAGERVFSSNDAAATWTASALPAGPSRCGRAPAATAGCSPAPAPCAVTTAEPPSRRPTRVSPPSRTNWRSTPPTAPFSRGSASRLIARRTSATPSSPSSPATRV